MKFRRKKAAGFLSPGASCHLPHCPPGLLDSRTRCRLCGWLICWVESSTCTAFTDFVDISEYFALAFAKYFHSMSGNITFNLMRFFRGLFAYPQAQINSPDALNVMKHQMFNRCTLGACTLKKNI